MVTLSRQTGDRERVCELLVNQGVVAHTRGDYAQAKSYYLEALPLARRIGYRYAATVLLGNLGEIAKDQGRYTQAQEYHHEALEIARQLGNRDQVSSSMVNLGHLAMEQGNYSKAAEQLQEALYRFANRSLSRNYSVGWRKRLISCKFRCVHGHVELKSEGACTICIFYMGLLNSYAKPRRGGGGVEWSGDACIAPCR